MTTEGDTTDRSQEAAKAGLDSTVVSGRVAEPNRSWRTRSARWPEEAYRALLSFYSRVAPIWLRERVPAPLRRMARRSLGLVRDAQTLVRPGARERTLIPEPPATRQHTFDSRREAAWIRELTRHPAYRRVREQRPLVSVILPTRDRADLLPKAVRSVLAQTYDNWQLLIVDDGSRDGTSDLVRRELTDRRVRLLRTEGLGVGGARNLGLEHATGDVIAYLDSDNRWTTRHLELSLAEMERSGAPCVYAALRVHDETKSPPSVWYRSSPFDHHHLRYANYIDLNVFVHTAQLFRDRGGFDESLARMVDWDLILRYTRDNPVSHARHLGADYWASLRPDRISNVESESWKDVVRNRHLMDWEALAAGAASRDPSLVSVIMCVHGSIDVTDACLSSLFDCDAGLPFELVLVDNGSEFEVRQRLESWAARERAITLIRNRENLHFALGNNMGFAHARGGRVVFLNNDTEVTPGWLRSLLGPLEDGGVKGVQPRLLFPDGRVQCVGMVFSPKSSTAYHIYKDHPGDAREALRPRRHQALTGACLGLRATDFAAAHGFDPIFVNGQEDVDLCLRIAGGEAAFRYVPESTVVHHESMTAGRGRHIGQNRRLFAERWADVLRADDTEHYAEDGFTVERYVKAGREPDGPTALYHPMLSRSGDGSAASEAASGRRSPSPPSIEVSARPLNVGFVSMWYVRGITFLTRQLALALEGSGFRTHVLARWESESFDNSGAVRHPRVLNGGDDPSPELTLDWVRQNHLDLVVFMEVHPKDWKRVEALRENGTRMVCYENFDILREQYLERYATFSWWLAHTRYASDEIRARFPRAQVLFVPWGADRPGTAAAEAPKPGARLRFVHVAGWGGLDNRKNSGLVVRAFARAGCTGADLHVFGQKRLEEYDAAAAEIARREPNIHVHEGTQGDAFRFYEGADCVLAPSKREGLGLPIVEALVSGVPVITTDGYMMKEWIEDGEHGLLCPATREEDGMLLPKWRVDEGVLAGLIGEVAGDRDRLEAMRKAVHRDRSRWLWSWQPGVLRREFTRIAHAPDGR